MELISSPAMVVKVALGGAPMVYPMEVRCRLSSLWATCTDVFVQLDIESGDGDLSVSDPIPSLYRTFVHKYICNPETRTEAESEYCNNINADSSYLQVTVYGYTAYTGGQLKFFNVHTVTEGGKYF